MIKDITQIGGLMNVVYSETQKLVCHNQVWKIQVDTYNRELERYGFNLINEVESIFHKDSECVLSIIKKINLSKKEDYRWMIALRMIDSLLSDFGYEISTKLKLIETLNKSFKKEFGFNKQNSKQLNSKFRTNRALIESVFNNSISDLDFFQLLQYVKKRTKNNIPIIERLYVKINKSEKNEQISSLLSSLTHMMMNRLFLTKNRIHELVLYDFLKRYYTSKLAKAKYRVLNET